MRPASIIMAQASGVWHDYSRDHRNKGFRGGGCVVNAPTIEGLRRFGDGFFVAASLRGYLEHEAEPLPVLKYLQRVLAPRAVAVVKVPNYASINRRLMAKRWCGFRYPDHLNYFTPKTLTAMAGEAGFDTGFGVTGRVPDQRQHLGGTEQACWLTARRHLSVSAIQPASITACSRSIKARWTAGRSSRR